MALQYHSGYTLSELGPLVRQLYAVLASPADENLRAVENKYSHKYAMHLSRSNEIFGSEFLISNLCFAFCRVFFEVAKLPLVHIETLEEALSEPDFTLC